MRKGRFQEAVKFANNFSLDVELAYKANVTWMFNALQPWTKAEASPLEDLFKIMDKIKVIIY